MVTIATVIISLSLLSLFKTQSGAISFIFILLISFALLSDLSRFSRKNAGILFGGYLFRVALLIWDLNCRKIFRLPGSGADSEVFYSLGKRFALGENITFEKNFVTVVGTIFKLIGNNRLFAQYLLMLCSIAAIVYMYKTMDLLDVSFPAKRKALILACFLPNFASLSSIFLRESIIILGVSASVYYFIKWFLKSGIQNLILAFLFSALACLMHGGCIAVIVGYIMVIFLYDKGRNRFDISFKNIILGSILFFIFLFFYNNFSDTLFQKVSGIESLADIGSTSTEGGSTYAQYVGDSTTIGRMAIFTIPRIVFYLFSPMPWMVRGLNDLIAVVFSSLVYLIITVKSLQYIKYAKNPKKRNVMICLVLVSFAFAFVFAWGTTNGGTALRHRDKAVALYIIMYSLCCDRGRNINWKRE